MQGRALCAAVVLCASAADSRAQGFDGERFVPATGAESAFGLEQPSVPFHLGWGLGLFVNYADDAVTYKAPTGVLSRPLHTAVTTDLVASLGLFNRVELGVGLPIHLVYEGDAYNTGTSTLAAGAGIGDLRFVPKVSIVRSGTLERHIALALAMPVSLPTGSSLALRGAGGVTLTPEILFGGYFGRFGIVVDAGYRWRAQHPPNLPWGDEIAIGVGPSFAFTNRLVGRGELLFAKEVGAAVADPSVALEALAGLDYAIGNSWSLYGGASFGITNGIGDPDYRIIVGVRFHHNVPRREGFLDSDGDGILDKDDRCPHEAEDFDGFEDSDGCPDPDNDHDGIPDAEDECPEMPGPRSHNGCPVKTFVKIENGNIFIVGKVLFRTGSAEVDHRSDALLDQLAAALNANPQVKHIRIEGHTDNVGDPGTNQRLSEARARSVKDALEKRRVDGGRLDTRGFGEAHPIAPNRSPGGRQKNRRVEFVIVEGR